MLWNSGFKFFWVISNTTCREPELCKHLVPARGRKSSHANWPASLENVSNKNNNLLDSIVTVFQVQTSKSVGFNWTQKEDYRSIKLFTINIGLNAFQHAGILFQLSKINYPKRGWQENQWGYPELGTNRIRLVWRWHHPSWTSCSRDILPSNQGCGSVNFRGSGKRVPLPLWPFISNVKNLHVVRFL